MKISFYSGVFARSGGIEEFTADLALALLDVGEEVEIVCASVPHPILDRLKRAGARITRVPFYHGCRWNLPDFVLYPWALARLRHADVVIHQKPFRPVFYRHLSRKPQHVFITAYHPNDQFPDAVQAQGFFSFFNRIVTQSQTFQRDLVGKGITCPIHVVPLIPPQIESGAVSAPPSGNVLKLGMFGRLERQKNPLYALAIAEALNECPPDGYSGVELNIYGTGSLEQELRRKADTCGLPVVFHGRYARDTVHQLIGGNHLCLITSVSEGQCIVALEVLACGRPVFATPVGALPDILSRRERGAVLPFDDVAAAADGIRVWLAREGGVDAPGIVRSYLEDYARDKIRDHYVELFSQTQGSSPAR